VSASTTVLGELDRAACAAALRELAVLEEDLARPAREGYPVERSMLDRLADRLAEVIGEGLPTDFVTYDEVLWSDAPERPAPRPDAFALHDRVTAAVAAANAVLPAAIGRWEVSRILRIDTCPHPRVRPGVGRQERRGHHVTAVLATLRTPSGSREVTASTEPQACGHDREES